MRKYNALQKMMAIALTLVMVLGMLPNITMPVVAAGEQASLSVTGKAADPSSFDNWEDYYGDDSLLPDGTRGTSTWKAGGVWTDKSVYADSTDFPSGVAMDNQQNNFLVALSALASNQEIVGQSSAPSDTMLVLDLSNSMDTSRSVDDMVAAANDTIDALLEMNVNNRVGVVLYSGNANFGNSNENTATVILPLDHYTTDNTSGNYLSVSGNSDTTVSVASGVKNSAGQRVSGSKNTIGGTYIQNGLYKAYEQFAGMTDKGVVASGSQTGTQRTPILILMSDGAPTVATDNYYNVGTSDEGNGGSTTNRITFLTQLTAAWVKGEVSAHYNDTAAKFYTIGLGTANSEEATAVLNPSGTTNNTLLSYWRNYNNGSTDNQTVTVIDNQGNNNDWRLTYKAVVETVGRNYVDQYWAASDSDEMIDAFQEIVDEIGLQSAYSATLVESGDTDLDGYITVQDELGAMIEVKDVKGILLGDTLFTGAELAESLTSMGTYDNPTDYGNEFVRTVMERIGTTTTSETQQLIGDAYEAGQLSYTNDTTYSNYIGWYGDADNNYLGFWQESDGYEGEGAPENAVYINKSYGYLGRSNEDSDADMMHIVVMVHTEIATGHQTVLFKIPSSLIPMITYKVELEGNSLETATEIDLAVTETDPIRLVYEVGLPDGVNNVNIQQKVAEYETATGMQVHKDNDGNYVFYANSWDTNNDGVAPDISGLTDAEKLAITAYLPESHFVPNTANERFYVQEDAVVYTRNGNAYTPVTDRINANGTYYFARTIVTIVNGTARAMTQYEQLQPATVANAANFQQNAAGQWEVKAGTIRQHLSNVILPKDENRTDTIVNTDQLWVNVTSSNPSDYNIYSFLGNNGKFTVAPATGIKVTKNVTEYAEGDDAETPFEITVTLSRAEANAVVTDAEGNALPAGTWSTTDNKTFVLNLKHGQTVYITGLTAGTTYTVAETADADYAVTYTGESGTVEAGKVKEAVVTNAAQGFGDLTIVKDINAVPANMPADMAAAMAAKEFTFQVDLGEAFAGESFAVDNSNAPETPVTDGKVTADDSGIITVVLKDNESITILDIPEGTEYTVTETNIPDGYIATVVSGGSVLSGTIQKGGDHDAHFINSYNPTKLPVKVQFTINKEIAGAAYTGTEEFKFQIQMLDEATGEYVNVGEEIIVANGNVMTKVVERTREFTNVGTYHFRIIEVEGTTPGMTYSSVRALFAVVVTDKNADGVLEAQVIDEGNTTVGVATVEGAEVPSVAADFVNTYEVGSTHVDIDLYKDLVNETGIEISKTSFHFGLYEVDAEGNAIGEPVYKVTPGEQGYAEIRLPVTSMDQNGETYILKEIIPDTKVPGMTYDTKEYKIVLNVSTVEGTNQLAATYSIGGVAEETNADDGVEATFQNKYELAGTSYTPIAMKELEGKTQSNDKFTFVLHQTGSSFDHDTNTIIQNKTREGEGEVTFDTLTFEKAGTYYYVVEEAPGVNPGMTYDTTHYHVTVTVGIDPEDATKLKVTNIAINKIGNNTDTSGKVVFVNTYAVTGTAQAEISGKKILKLENNSEKVLSAGDYTFGLYAVDSEGKATGEPLQEKTNRADGTFAFEPITYSAEHVGTTFTYVIQEIVPEEAENGVYQGTTYSSLSVTVTVKVIDNGDGTMKTEVSYSEEEDFINTYSSTSTSASFKGKKTLEGRTLKAGEFTFELYKADENFSYSEDAKVDETTNALDGTFTLGTGELNVTGYHYYVLKEQIPADDARVPGVGYDTTEYHITVNVVDLGRGAKSTLISIAQSGDPNASFTASSVLPFKNIYTPEDDQYAIGGSKELNGGTALAEGDFTFALYQGAEELGTAEVKADGTFVFDAITYTAVDIGDHTYTVKEVIPAGAVDNGDGTKTVTNADGSKMVYDASAFTVVVTVSVDADGVLKFTETVKKNDTAAELKFTNTYIPAPVTIQIDVTKTVENKTQPGIGPDGFEIQLYEGDTQRASAETGETGKVAFQITYSAEDIGKTATYKVVEKKGKVAGVTYDATVHNISVTVKQNEDGALYTIINEQETDKVSVAFKNTYEKPATPITGDTFPVILVGGLLLISAAAIVVLLMTKKQRKGGKYAR